MINIVLDGRKDVVDYFKLSGVSEYEPVKSARNVVKVVGPKGGFRYLSYEYLREDGSLVRDNTAFKDKAKRLEKFFADHGIVVTIQIEN